MIRTDPREKDDCRSRAITAVLVAAMAVLAAATPTFSQAIWGPSRGIHLPDRDMTSEMIAAAEAMDPGMVVVLANAGWDHANDNYTYASTWIGRGTLYDRACRPARRSWKPRCLSERGGRVAREHHLLSELVSIGTSKGMRFRN